MPDFASLIQGLGQQNKPDPWNISGTNGLGFSGDYAQQMKSALGQVANNQYADSMQQANENAISGGSFNPQLSNYYATKGARETQQKGNLQAIQSGRDDEFKKFQVMNSINNFNLQDKYFNLQNQQYQDSKPGFWDDILGGISTLGGILPTLAEGGQVQDSDYFHQVYNSIIPPGENNMYPTAKGDNTMIVAKTGERIIRPEGDKMTGGATQLINDAVETIKGLIH